MTIYQLERALSTFEIDGRIRIAQLVVRDHTSMAPSHVHVRVDRQTEGRGDVHSSSWITFNVLSMDDLRAAVSNHRSSAGAPLRMVTQLDGQSEPPTPNATPFGGLTSRQHFRPADRRARSSSSGTPQESYLELLWSTFHTLTHDEAEALRVQDKGSCPVCLDELSAGDELLCLPCEGRHAGHWACMRPWLEQSPSCPCCRFAMKPASESERTQLIESSLAAAAHVMDDGEAHRMATESRWRSALQMARRDEVRCEQCDDATMGVDAAAESCTAEAKAKRPRTLSSKRLNGHSGACTDGGHGSHEHRRRRSFADDAV